MRTVPVQLVCRKCANPFRTTVRGGNTRCPHCRASRHVRVNQEWEGPVSGELSGAATRAVQAAARPAVWVECGCGHEWQSRAKDRMTIHCPQCGTGVRVPRRTTANTGPVPEGCLPAPAPAAPRPPRPARRAEPEDDDWDDDDDQDEPDGTPLTTWWTTGGRDAMTRALSRPQTPAQPSRGLGVILAALGAQTAPAAPAPAPRPSRPAPAPVPAVPRPAPAGGSAGPVDPQELSPREVTRRDTVCQISRSLCAPLMVWYNQPPGACEALDTTLPSALQRCPGRATHVVRFRKDVVEADAYTCPEHARPLAETTDRTDYITATIYRLK